MEGDIARNGVQQLLTADQEAQRSVNASRNAKMARLKQAKEEADEENAQFRAQMEIDFHRKLAEGSGNSGANVKRLEQETKAKIHQLKTEAARVSHDIVHMLMKDATNVNNYNHAKA